MSFLFDKNVLTALFWVIAILTPLSAAIIVAMVPRLRNKRFFFPFALTGPIAGIMWLGFNAICNIFGLDSLIGLLINLLIFCVAGAALGITYRLFFPKIERVYAPRTISLKPRSEMNDKAVGNGPPSGGK